MVGRFWRIFEFAKSIEQKVVEGIFELSELRFCQIFQAAFAGLGVLKRIILFGLRELDLTTLVSPPPSLERHLRSPMVYPPKKYICKYKIFCQI